MATMDGSLTSWGRIYNSLCPWNLVLSIVNAIHQHSWSESLNTDCPTLDPSPTLSTSQDAIRHYHDCGLDKTTKEVPEIWQRWRKQAWFFPGWRNPFQLYLLSTNKGFKSVSRLPDLLMTGLQDSIHPKNFLIFCIYPLFPMSCPEVCQDYFNQLTGCGQSRAIRMWSEQFGST